MRLSFRFLIISFISLLFACQGCGSGSGTQNVQFQTEYQAIVLANGQLFFGKAEVGSDFVTLKDVFYAQSQVNQETKEVRNTLIKRGKEAHGPDLMLINKNHVLFIEPVSPDSQIGKVIQEAQKASTTK